MKNRLNKRNFFLAAAMIAALIMIVYLPHMIFIAMQRHAHFLSVVTGILLLTVVYFFWIKKFIKTPAGIGEFLINPLQGENTMRSSKIKQVAILDLIEKMNDGLGVHDKNGTIRYVNDYACRTIGYPKNEIVGRHVFEFLDKKNQAILAVHFSQLEKGNYKNYELEWQGKNGKRIPSIISPIPLFDSEGRFTGGLAIITDITCRKENEETLKLSEEKFHSIVRYLSDILWIIDEDTTIRFESESSTKILGYEAGCLIGKTGIDFVHPDDVEVVQAEMSKLITKTNDHVPTEFRFRHAAGHWIYLEAIGNNLTDTPGIEGLVITARDITARKKYESELAEASKIINKSPAVAFLWRKGEGWPVEFASRNVLELTGYTVDDFTSGRIIYRDIIHPDDIDRVASEVNKYSADMEVTCFSHIPYRIITKDGKAKWVDDTTDIRRDKNGEVTHYQGIVVDITQRKIAEESLKISEQRYKSLIETSPIPIIVHSDSKIVYANSCTIKTLEGQSKDDFIGRPIMDFVHPDFHDIVRQRVKGIYDNADKAELLEEKFVTLKNRVIDVEVVGTQIEYGGKTASLAVFQDISMRKRAEQALVESEEKYRNVAERANDGIVIVQDGLLKYCNFAIEKMLGYTREEMIGTHINNYIHPDKLNMVMGIYKKRIAGIAVPSYYESVLVSKDGRNIDVEFNSGIIQYMGRPASLAFIRDIRQTKLADKALRESEEKFRNLAQHSPNMIFINIKGQIKYVNDKCEEIMGYSKEEFYSPDFVFMNLIDPQYIDMVNDNFKKHTAGIDVEPYEFAIVTKSGQKINSILTTKLISFDGENAILGLVTDITEIKKVEENLKNSEKRFQELFNSVMEAIVLIDEKGIIEYHNPAFARIFEEDDSAVIIGKDIRDYIAPSEFGKFTAESEKRRRGISSQYEIDMITAKKAKKTMHVSVVPRLDDEGIFIGSLGALIDITETKKLQEFLARAQRLETAGRIAGQVAHDFNNLLGPLMAYPEFIKAELEESHPAIQYLTDIESAAEQMADINQQLLTLGRRGHYNLEPLNLNDIVLEVINHIKPLPGSLVLSLNLADDLMCVNGGGSQIYRAILNLITNARDAMLDAGKLTVSTQNCRVESMIGKFGRVLRGEYAKLTISDTGTGIPNEHLPKILEPFFSTKIQAQKRGSGLGLSIVHAVIEDHKGYIDIESEKGKGTSFHLYIPVTRDSIKETQEETLTGGNERILIVDDDQIQRTVSLRLLKTLGYRAIAVESGEKALKLIEHEPQDLIILDMIMPGGMDGYETYERILKIYPRQKALVVSGYAESGRVNQLIDLGAGGFIRKPLTYKSIGRAVREELDKVTAISPSP